MTPAEIKALRKRLGETQTEFASRFAVNIQAVQRWEYGSRNPSGAALILLEQLATKKGKAKT